MMQRLAIWIVSILEKKGALRSGVSRETYIYGFDIAIYTFLSTFGLFLIGWIADRPIETALLIFLYYTNQSSGGGFHASSHLMCFLTMVLGELLFLASFLLPYSPFTCSGISVISLSCGRIRLFSIQTKAISKRKRLNSLSILVKFCWLKLPC